MNEEKKKTPKQSQYDLFKQAAKDHNCDEKTDLKKIIKKISNSKQPKQ